MAAPRARRGDGRLIHEFTCRRVRRVATCTTSALRQAFSLSQDARTGPLSADWRRRRPLPCGPPSADFANATPQAAFTAASGPALPNRVSAEPALPASLTAFVPSAPRRTRLRRSLLTRREYPASPASWAKPLRKALRLAVDGGRARGGRRRYASAVPRPSSRPCLRSRVVSSVVCLVNATRPPLRQVRAAPRHCRGVLAAVGLRSSRGRARAGHARCLPKGNLPLLPSPLCVPRFLCKDSTATAIRSLPEP